MPENMSEFQEDLLIVLGKIANSLRKITLCINIPSSEEDDYYFKIKK